MSHEDQNRQPALELSDLSVRYGRGCFYCLQEDAELRGNRCPLCGSIWAVRDISLQVYPGEILGIVGESGSGKSTLVKALYLDIAPQSGDYRLNCYREGQANIYEASIPQRKIVRHQLLGMVYQNPHLGLRMGFSVGANVAEKLIAAGNRHVGMMTERTAELLEHMEVPLSRVKEPPNHFSGGMQQRVQIAKAVANNPPLLFLDEITTGLDLSVQARVLDLVLRLQQELKIAMLVVSHDLAVIRMLANRTLVMLGGRIIESGLTDQILEDPQHPFTQILVHSLLV